MGPSVLLSTQCSVLILLRIQNYKQKNSTFAPATRTKSQKQKTPLLKAVTSGMDAVRKCKATMADAFKTGVLCFNELVRKMAGSSGGLSGCSYCPIRLYF